MFRCVGGPLRASNSEQRATRKKKPQKTQTTTGLSLVELRRLLGLVHNLLPPMTTRHSCPVAFYRTSKQKGGGSARIGHRSRRETGRGGLLHLSIVERLKEFGCAPRRPHWPRERRDLNIGRRPGGQKGGTGRLDGGRTVCTWGIHALPRPRAPPTPTHVAVDAVSCRVRCAPAGAPSKHASAPSSGVRTRAAAVAAACEVSRFSVSPRVTAVDRQARISHHQRRASMSKEQPFPAPFALPKHAS